MSKYFNMDGYVCGKIETRTTQSGNQITTFSINSPKRKKQGEEWVYIPQFFNCKYWHKFDNDFRAAQITSKAHIHIAGEPDYEEWEKDGQKRSKVSFNVRDLFLIAPKDSTPSGSIEDYSAPEFNTDVSVYDSDIPF